jgi:GT2 family glycosyltransferase
MGDLKNMPKLSIHLVAWNGAKYIPYLFDSLRKQTFLDWQLFILDNNSTDETVAAIKKELENFPVHAELVENKTNLGFAGGHNFAFAKTESEYILMLNQDMYLESDCMEKLVRFLDAAQDCAAVAPRLMKWGFSKATENLQSSFTDQVDSLGLQVFRNRRVVEKFAQQSWSDLKEKIISRDGWLPVFGVSGAMPVFRRSALQQIMLESGEVFDLSYHAYKEDVDLAYRLASSGKRACVLLDAVAYHDRSAAGPKDIADHAAMANKKTQSQLVKYLSYKNHLMTLYKNEYWQNLILDFPWIMWYELKKFIFFLILDREVLRGLREIWCMRADLVKKRQWIMRHKKLAWRDIRQLWNL